MAALSLTIAEKNTSTLESDFAKCMEERQLYQRGNTGFYRAVVAVLTGVVTYDRAAHPQPQQIRGACRQPIDLVQSH